MKPIQSSPPRWLSPKWTPPRPTEATARTPAPGETPSPWALPLGEYARDVIGEQFHQVVKREKAVLAGTDPEALHQMRVATRRLRTALRLFGPASGSPPARESAGCAS